MVDAVGPSGAPARDQLSSRTLAFASAGANLILCAVLVTILVVVNGRPDNVAEAFAPPTGEPTAPVFPPVAAPTEPSSETSSETSSTSQTWTTPIPAGPDGFQAVDGPGGMATVVPTGWSSVPAKGAGSLQADDPADSSRFVRYGGAPAPAEDIYSSHVTYERDFSVRAGFQSIRLDEIDFHGLDAVDWEFELDSPEGRRHARSLYWRSGGYEFFVYASSPVSRWSETQPILDTMIANASP